MTPHAKPPIAAYAAWLSVCFFWGTTYLAIRIGVGSLPPALFAGIRFVIAGVLFMAMARLAGLHLPPKEAWKDMAISGFLFLAFGNGLVVYAEQFISSGMTAIIISTTPMWVVIAESLLPPRRGLNLLAIAGLLLGTGGVCIIFRRELMETAFDFEHVRGLLCALLATLGWSAGTLFVKRSAIHSSPLAIAGPQNIIGGSILVLLGLALGEAPDFHLNLSNTLSMGYLIVFGSLVGYGSFIYALSKLPAAVVTTYAYINPFVALTLGWIVLHEPLSPAILLGSCITIAGVALVNRSTRVAPPQT
ncbi:MAG: EamA family transporter [Candidatus Hydrogenedentales bacterium]|jgi:drug/metabolite transporter (DMT)-like permease